MGKKEEKEKSEIFLDILETIIERSSNVIGAAIISREGLTIYSKLQKDLNSEIGNILPSVSANLAGLGSRILTEREKGELEYIVVEGILGDILITSAGEHAWLIIETVDQIDEKDVDILLLIAETFELEF